MRPASERAWIAFCLHLKWAIMTKVINAGTISSGA